MEKEEIQNYIEARIKNGSLAEKLSQCASVLKINSEEEDKTCSTKYVIPPKSKDSGILPNFT